MSTKCDYFHLENVGSDTILSFLLIKDDAIIFEGKLPAKNLYEIFKKSQSDCCGDAVSTFAIVEDNVHADYIQSVNTEEFMNEFK